MSAGASRLSQILKDRLALFGIVVILMASVIAILGANIRPDSSKDANQQNIAIARKSPGFQANFFKIAQADSISSSGFFGNLFFGGSELRERTYLMDSLSIHTDQVVLCWKGEQTVTVPVAELAEMSGASLATMTLEEVQMRFVERKTYLLGTDSFGRDMLSRLMGGTLVSLSVGFISVIISLVIGIGSGAIAGYFGGRIDDIVMWLINVIWSIPTLLMVIAITMVMGKGFVQVFIAVGLTMWVEVARIVRGQFLSLRTLPFVEAGQSMGYSSLRLIWRHLLPNAMGPVIVISAANFASAILIEAGLSFLGIGTQIPTPSWGGMIKEHYAYITTDMAYLAILPGLCITVLVLAFMLIGNRLRDILDVRN